MSAVDALLNIGILFVVMTPLMVLAWWVMRQTPVTGLSGPEKWWAYRIRIGAGSLILVSGGLLVYFVLNLIG